jgi:hypothetical protein
VNFDEPFVVDRSRALTAAEQEQWRRVKRKRGRPRVGQGFKRISVSIEQGLLKRVTKFAQEAGISRSKVIAKALELLCK